MQKKAVTLKLCTCIVCSVGKLNVDFLSKWLQQGYTQFGGRKTSHFMKLNDPYFHIGHAPKSMMLFWKDREGKNPLKVLSFFNDSSKF